MGKRLNFATVVGCALLAVACSSADRSREDRKPVHPVRGQVFVGGNPAVGAFVFLVPVGEAPEPTEARPRAEVGADGSFEVSMYGDKDGAPAGEYVVTLLWEGEGGFDKLKGQYSDASKSKLRATVKEGRNELPPIKLN